MKNRDLFRKQLGDKLKEVRIHKGHTLEFVGNHLELGINAIHRYEKGLSPITFENLLLYLKVCDKDYDEFMSELKQIIKQSI